MFLRDIWYAAGFASDLDDGALLPLKLIGDRLVLYRRGDGTIVAFEDRCAHRAAPLSLGERDGDNLRCLYHGLLYDPDGRCIHVPGQAKVGSAMAVRSFPAVERNGWIWIWMGDRERADPALIPAILPEDGTAWNIRAGSMDYRAHYELLNDNLTDFSHVSYVHRASFGASAEFADNPPRITPIDRGLRFERWLIDGFDAESPLADQMGKELVGGTATWQAYDYIAPGILIFYVERHPRDRVPADGFSPPSTPPLSHFRQAQAVTPMDERSTRYLYLNAIPEAPGSDALSDGLMAVFDKAFTEDRIMIEAQQRVIDDDPDRAMGYVQADEGPARMRRVIQRLLAAEGAACDDLSKRVASR